jgi:hypothetical protein
LPCKEIIFLLDSLDRTIAMPISAAHSAAARHNGAKSHGPTTEAGKAVASLNRLPPGVRHARLRFLESEDPALLEQMRQIRLHAFQPRDIFERDAVEAMARAEYHLARLEGLYSDHALATEAGPYAMSRAMISGQAAFDGYDAFGKWIEREERNLDRAHRRLIRHRTALKRGLFEKVANEPIAAPPQEMPNEPTVAPPPEIALEPKAPPPPPEIATEPKLAATLLASAAIPAQKPVIEPTPAPATPPSPQALYAELTRLAKRDHIDERVRQLSFPEMQGLMALIQARGCVDRQPYQALWAWKAMLKRW